MSGRLRFLFDACIGRVTIERISSFLKVHELGIEFAHLSDFEKDGTLDDDWVPRLAGHDWIVISSDRGRTPSRGSKLPLVCKKYGVTHVLLSAAVHQLSGVDKSRAIISVWHQLTRLREFPRGSEHVLQMTVSGGFRLHSKAKRLTEEEVREQQKTQSELFDRFDDPPRKTE